MKKIVFGLILLATAAYAAAPSINRIARLGPASPAMTPWSNGEAATTVAAGAAGVRSCLTKLSVASSVGFTARVLDGGTTVYAVDVGTTTGRITTGGGAVLSESWKEDEMCGTAATAFTIKISTPINQGQLDTVKMNYSGFTY